MAHSMKLPKPEGWSHATTDLSGCAPPASPHDCCAPKFAIVPQLAVSEKASMFLPIYPTNAKVSRSRSCAILGHADELSWFREGAVACA